MLNSKRKLKPKDAERFAKAEPAFFSELAAVVCRTGILPEKELHECWQMAQIVHRLFPKILHVADIAAGHGLLGWILVLLARLDVNPIPRTAVAVDIIRPKSADVLAKAFKQNWPDFAEAVHYVEGSIDAVRAGDGPRTLLVAVHACGSLSDRVLIAAIASGSPVAIMPCCHSLRNQVQTLSVLETLSGRSVESGAGHPESIDQFRKDVLSSLGYAVSEESIQPEITAFHRIIIGSTPAGFMSRVTAHNLTFLGTVKRRGEIRAFERIQLLNVADMNQVRALSQRPSREWVRAFDLSFWIDDVGSEEQLSALLLSLLNERSFATSVRVLDRYEDSKTMKMSVTFHVEMKSSTHPITKDDALGLRNDLCLAMQSKYVLRG